MLKKCLSVFITLAVLGSPLVLSECPGGFVHNGDSCYLFSILRVSWIQAMKFCEIYQGELAVIETEAEQLFLESYLNSTWKNANQTDVWISGTDLLVDGEWIWAKEGRSIDYFRWAPGQPDSASMNLGGEDCIELVRGSNFMWNDVPCQKHINFVCERPFMVSADS
ncbi:perlucin-like [Mytilus galloprovincialis]|uniref:C-type lectin domain-containing protein n=1 Tax=Mytilus galloprovincialis TaxID=29158 RepID=A0A8B6GRT8_MYTGA|nr:Hypothetical predicted protein [Mytilus galloprovincialis]